jgi:hypothetical protein
MRDVMEVEGQPLKNRTPTAGFVSRLVRDFPLANVWIALGRPGSDDGLVEVILKSAIATAWETGMPAEAFSFEVRDGVLYMAGDAGGRPRLFRMNLAHEEDRG